MTSEIDGLSHAAVESVPPAAEAGRLSPVGPLSVIGVEERKRHPVFDCRWTEKFAFVRLPDVPRVDPSLGERTIKRVLKLPIERRQVPFLVRREALERCSIWGRCFPSFLLLVNVCPSAAFQVRCWDLKEAFVEYKRALEVMSAKKTAPKRAAPSETKDEVQFVRSSKRQATAPASSSKKKLKASGSTPKVSPSSSGDPAIVLANLNTKVFPLTRVSLPEDSLAAIQSIQSDLIQAMSRFFHLGERMDDHASLEADIAALTSHLHEEKDSVLAKEKEIKALRLKEPRRGWDVSCIVEYFSEGAIGAPRGGGMRFEETFDVEKSMAVSGAIVVTRWEVMREWLNHQTDSWDFEGALEQYKRVKTSEAEFQGLPAPSFEGEPMIPSKTEAEKTLEHAADDPHVD
ncbi:LOW QUALITY PROTEIN: hypothetical protein HID58_066813 [Brassica napus]|uniref:Uncharacterized protein n=1 Tax=Brassica napus TaxID=3708 RepID=A0ABQ7ZGQ9_BRANA|nr:LOW QUALITY PROTEIN: hypothetical protein HID58_066813 [Brassica napus]